jgi:hypothetical protein
MHALDDPVWGSLVGTHAVLALRSGRAARYPADVGPLGDEMFFGADHLPFVEQALARSLAP